MTIYAERKETVLADIPRVIPCSSRVSHYDRLAAVPGDGGFRCQDDDAGLGSAGGGWEEPVSIVVPMFTRQPEGPPIAIMFVMPRSWRAPPAIRGACGTLGLLPSRWIRADNRKAAQSPVRWNG